MVPFVSISTEFHGKIQFNPKSTIIPVECASSNKNWIEKIELITVCLLMSIVHTYLFQMASITTLALTMGLSTSHSWLKHGLFFFFYLLLIISICLKCYHFVHFERLWLILLIWNISGNQYRLPICSRMTIKWWNDGKKKLWSNTIWIRSNAANWQIKQIKSNLDTQIPKNSWIWPILTNQQLCNLNEQWQTSLHQIVYRNRLFFFFFSSFVFGVNWHEIENVNRI